MTVFNSLDQSAILKQQIIQIVSKTAQQITTENIGTAREFIRIIEKSTNNPTDISEQVRLTSLEVLQKYSKVLSSASKISFEQLEASVGNGIGVLANLLSAKPGTANESNLMNESLSEIEALTTMSHAILSKKVSGINWLKRFL